MPRMVEQKIRSAVPLYLAAGLSAASALLPIYQWWAIVLAGVLAAGVYWVADKRSRPARCWWSSRTKPAARTWTSFWPRPRPGWISCIR